MSAALAHLESLRQWLSHSLAAIFREAIAIEQPAGSSPTWLQACQFHGVPPLSDAERDEVRRAQSPLRGAPVMELSQMVTSVVRQAHQSLRAVVRDDSPAVESALEKLKMLLDRTEREAVDAYKRAVLPKRQGMFANVLAHHDAGASTAFSGGAHTLLCGTCGAPRLNDRDFNCPFCGNHMANVT